MYRKKLTPGMWRQGPGIAATFYPRGAVPILANISRNHRDYGATPAEHEHNKRVRAVRGKADVRGYVR